MIDTADILVDVRYTAAASYSAVRLSLAGRLAGQEIKEALTKQAKSQVTISQYLSL